MVEVSLDRKVAVITWLALGDALGAPHEFNAPLPDDFVLSMTEGGGWGAGEWTDDTDMAICILQAWQEHGEFGSRESLDTLVKLWRSWAHSAMDVGVQTRSVLESLKELTAEACASAAKDLHERTGRSAGNGSLMRTAPLAFLEVSDEELTRITVAVSKLTHFEDDAADACVLWVQAIRANLRDTPGTDPIKTAVDHLPADRQKLWCERIEAARKGQPRDFPNNGWVVSAFQAAVSAIHEHDDQPRIAVERAVRCGWDTDTVAAITGAYVGSRAAALEFPTDWLERLHGWPGLDAYGLAKLCHNAN